MVAIATLAVAALASLFMAWAIGAGSSGSTPFAPAVGANAISVMRAGFVVGILGLAGAFLQGANVTEAVGSELVVGGSLSPTAAIVALATAAALVAVGVFAGYPIATAFTVTGAVVGSGLALGLGPAWPKYVEIASLWLLTPFIGGGIAFVTAKLLRNERVPESVAVPALAFLVGILLANIEFVILGPGNTGRSIASAATRAVVGEAATGTTVLAGTVLATLAFAGFFAGLLRLDLTRDEAAGQRHFLLALGGLVAFSAGGSQVGLALGPLIPLLEQGNIDIALSQDYSSLGSRRSIAALIPSFAIAQSAVFFGVPVSFNEIIVSAIIGSGYAAGGAGVSRQKMVYTVLAWLGSLALALGVSYGGFLLVDALLQL